MCQYDIKQRSILLFLLNLTRHPCQRSPSCLSTVLYSYRQNVIVVRTVIAKRPEEVPIRLIIAFDCLAPKQDRKAKGSSNISQLLWTAHTLMRKRHAPRCDLRGPRKGHVLGISQPSQPKGSWNNQIATTNVIAQSNII